jgi:hypothetical protein
MRFSDWRKGAPAKAAVAPKVVSVVTEALETLGADRDPECWVAWGDDPSTRYLLLVPTVDGLVQVNVRVDVIGEGPRASGKVVRWNRVQIGELSVEMQGGHRLVTFQVETQALHGADANADAISMFARAIYAAIDGRLPTPPARSRRPSTTAAGRGNGPGPGGGGSSRKAPTSRSS